MHHPRSALVALCLVVALAAAACSFAVGAPVPGDGSAESSTSTTAGSSPGSARGTAPRAVPPSSLQAEPVGKALQDGGPVPPPDDGDPQWHLGPQWATEPELLQGSQRFEELTHKGRPDPGEPTNIVLITADDMRADDLRWMPKTRALIGRAGTSFSDSLSPHPLCCPARAQILTGQFAQNNGVRSNHSPSGGYGALDADNTLPGWLQDAGYHTVFLGKYLNEYAVEDPHEVPPGWTSWMAPVRRVYDYFTYLTNTNGVLARRSGISQTELYTDVTQRAIPDLAARREPFFIWQSHLAPHTSCPEFTRFTEAACWQPPTPDPEHQGVFDDVRSPARDDPAYDEPVIGDKPGYLRKREPGDPDVDRWRQELFQRRIESLQSVDDAVARTVDALDQAGVLDETLVIFTSDNGYQLGEHRYSGKNLPFEPSLQVPLLMRGPGVPAGVVRRATTGTLDLAPTILAAARARPGVALDGRNLLPVAQGDRPGWETTLIQAGPRSLAEEPSWFWRGVRTDRYTYVEYPTLDEVELYDRARDPHQLRNLAGQPGYAATQAELQRRLRALEDCVGAQCRQTFGPVPAPGGARTGG